ncbi:CPBP family intramembrane metalloprotease [Flagellimonas lutimaris]|jgi:membrane protease YdiL (CAAX protease family)|uniref:CPBP family intramembrane metalloprotease n=1 Tax=Flagellimonas lutimaris TaxID=475082 RepID=A0A3A1N8K8_9FLAO|nr:type II CAAX endopeptidase family protein [Allomuricauda lutimaris]RIV35213.1 CPBP family intramembrane metalloprotease [Allomuricauda lutimaris]
MLKNLSDRKEAWKTIFLFLLLVVALTSPFHYAIVNLYPSRIYVGAIMWCPAIAAFITLKIKGRKITSLNWNWGDWKYIRLSYLIPAFYGIITYVLIWIFELGDLANKEVITDWGAELGLFGIGTLNPTSITIIAIILLGTVEVIRASATTLGEEIGWRGFFIYELRKVLSFTGVSIFSGIIWAAWHWPLLVYYSSNVLLEFITFFIVIISMSFIMAYFTFKSKSLWPAVLFHAVSNVFIQKIMPPLTMKIEGSEHWLGENGIMFAIVTCVFGIYFWYKGIKEKL